MRTTGNTIFIPGATGGLGLGFARRWHAAGNQVIVGGRREDRLAAIARETPGIGTVVIDTADPESVRSVSADVQTRWPDVDVLVAMAGIMRTEDMTTPAFLADAEETVTTNVLGPIRLVAAWSQFLAGKPGATILTVSSGLAFLPRTVNPTYDGSKAFVHQWSRAMRAQLAPAGIQVIELVPPSVQSDLEPGHADDPRAMPQDEYLDETLRLLAEQPDAEEILVERVKFLRNAEIEGRYDDALAILNGAH